MLSMEIWSARQEKSECTLLRTIIEPMDLLSKGKTQIVSKKTVDGRFNERQNSRKQEQNMSDQNFFADGIGEITLSGGMVRMDLVTLVGSQNNPENKPRLELSRRIVMPPDGFLRSFSAMENLVKQLIDAGLVKPRAEEGMAPSANPEPNGGGPAKSPNF